MANGKYRYNTSVILPGGSAFAFNGAQRSTGAILSFSAAATPGGRLRRLTLGFDLNFGGLDLLGHPVVPPGSLTPFSQDNLNQIAQQSLINTSWNPSISPFIEHAIGTILQNRVGFGYQYLQTARSENGSFPADQSGSIQARYSVGFTQTLHMIRLSVRNESWFDDTDKDQPPPRRTVGIVKQGGVLIGTNGSVIVFFNLGPVWNF